MALIDVQRGAVELCLGDEPKAQQLEALGDQRIWLLYREMVQNRLLSELRMAFRRTYSAAGKQAFERAFVHYLAKNPPRVRYVHALASDFARSALPLFRADAGMPPLVADLLEYEAALRAVTNLSDQIEAPYGEFAFDKRAVLAPALRLLELQHAVHKKAEATGYRAGVFHLCVVRRAQDKKPVTWTLNAVTYALMQYLMKGEHTVSETVQQVATERGIAMDQHFVDGLCTVLADFIERQLILGAR